MEEFFKSKILTYFSSWEAFGVCMIVFLAVVLPIAFWRREGFVDRSIPEGDWRRLPGLFKTMWRPVCIFEMTLGELCVRMAPGVARRYAVLSEIAALPLTARRVFACKMIYTPLFGALGATLFLLVPTIPKIVAQVAAVVLVLLGWFLPSMALAGEAQKRQEDLTRTLPFAIDLIGSAMRSGLEFGAAMRYYVTSGGKGALIEEFSRVLREAALGVSIPEGLQAMAARVRLKSFTAFAGVVSYSADIGASIADTLKAHGAEMRRERFALAEQKAARAPALMIFPIAMFILPAVFLVIFVPVMLQYLSTQSM